MKLAINKAGETIMAEADAPAKAICPYCKGTVILRSRKNSFQPDQVTYFWRHESHANPGCEARFRHLLVYRHNQAEEPGSQ